MLPPTMATRGSDSSCQCGNMQDPDYCKMGKLSAVAVNAATRLGCTDGKFADTRYSVTSIETMVWISL